MLAIPLQRAGSIGHLDQIVHGLVPDVGTGQEGHGHNSGRIGEERPGPDFGVNVIVEKCQKQPAIN